MKSLSRVRLFATPWTVAYQAPLSMGFSRQEYWSRLPFPSPGDLPDPGIGPRSPALQADALPSKPPGISFVGLWLKSPLCRLVPINCGVYPQCVGLDQYLVKVSWFPGTETMPMFCWMDLGLVSLKRSVRDGLVGSPCSPRDSQESSLTPWFKSINSLAFSHLYGPTLTSVQDYWKNHCFDYTLSAKWCLCYLVHCLGLSKLFFQGESIF